MIHKPQHDGIIASTENLALEVAVSQAYSQFRIMYVLHFLRNSPGALTMSFVVSC